MKRKKIFHLYYLGFIMLFNQCNVQASNPLKISPPDKSFSIILTDDFIEVFNENNYMYYSDNVNYISLNLYKKNKAELRLEGINSLSEYKQHSMQLEKASKTNQSTARFEIISTGTDSKGHITVEATYTMNRRSDFYSKYAFIEGKDSYYLLAINTMGGKRSNTSIINNILNSFKEQSSYSSETNKDTEWLQSIDPNIRNKIPKEDYEWLGSLDPSIRSSILDPNPSPESYGRRMNQALLNTPIEEYVGGPVNQVLANRQSKQKAVREDVERMESLMKRPSIERQNMYRPTSTVEDIGLQVDGYSRYDDNIQTMSDIENIEEFRRRARNNEIEDVGVKVGIVVSIIIILLVIKLCTKDGNTMETNNSTQAEESPSIESEAIREEITSITIPKVGDNLNSQQPSWFTRNAWWIALAIAIFLFKMCSDMSH